MGNYLPTTASAQDLSVNPQSSALLGDRSTLQDTELRLSQHSSSVHQDSSLTQTILQAAQNDPKTALIWRNFTTGNNRTWVMDGATQLATASLPNLQDPDWRLVGTNDYDGNGQPDLLWRNVKTGANGWWVVKGTADRTVVSLPSAQDLDWEIVGTNDYDRDGQVDLLWRNAKTGGNAWWLMNGSQRKSVVSITSAKGKEWQIVSTNDYNRDGQIDVLWRNVKTGDNAWWVMSGSTLQSAVLLPSVADLTWSLVGTSDYDRDGQVDLLWRNQQSGQTGWWVMNSDQIQKVVLLPTESDLNWQIVGVSDRYIAPLPNLATAPISPALREDIVAGLGNAQLQSSVIFNQQRAITSNNPVDLYQFTLAQSGIFTASLTNLTGDADVRLIQDLNGNGKIDADQSEIKAWQWERGTQDESIRSFLNPGTYLVQVLGYNGQSADYRLATNFTAAASDSQKFIINLQYDSSLSGLGENARQAIKNAANFWESVIPYRSAITQSNVLTIKVSGQSLDFSTFALAGPTFESDGKTVTIASADTYINTQRLAFFNANPDYLQAVITHEFAHSLGFGTLWEPVQFATGKGTSVNVGKNLINRSNATYNIVNSLGNTTYASWTYGDLLGTHIPTAVPIEPSIFAHWDETRFRSESLTPYAEAAGILTPVSALTIASLRDIGWNVNYGASQAYQLPKNVSASTALASDTTVSSSSTGMAASQAALSIQCGCTRCLAAVSMPTLGTTQLADVM